MFSSGLSHHIGINCRLTPANHLLQLPSEAEDFTEPADEQLLGVFGMDADEFGLVGNYLRIIQDYRQQPSRRLLECFLHLVAARFYPHIGWMLKYRKRWFHVRRYGFGREGARAES